MFDNQRFKTVGVEREISIFRQFLMWEMIDEIDVEKDYLQIFKLSAIEVGGVMVQEIIHSQEQPPYEKRIVLNELTKPVNAKVYVIDDTTYSTMLLAEER